jgi:hypothetical protein
MTSSTKSIVLLLKGAATLEKTALDIFISKPAEASPTDRALLDIAIDAIFHAHETINITSALPGFEHNAKIVHDARQQMNDMIFERLRVYGLVTEKFLFNIITLALRNNHAGNCYEFAFFAHWLLISQDIHSEIFRVRGNTGDSHVFLVLNRDTATRAHDFHAWNLDTIVVDPYLEKIYLASEIPTYLESCVHDEKSHRVRYIPFNDKTHKLDNLVLKGHRDNTT